MQARRTWLFATRGVVAAAGLMFLLALQPEPAGITSDRFDSHARALILSDQARRYLTLQYRSYPTEFMGCMIGEIHGNAVIVRRVVPEQTCEDAGWAGTVGMIHSHPDGQRCWYFFPGTRVASSDAHSFARQAYPVDAIMCGNRVGWVSRDMVEQQVRLADPDG